MYKIIITLSSIFFTLNLSAQSADHQYIWARSGLNLRAEPSAKSKIVDKLAFGDSLIVISETGISYNTVGIKNVDTTHYNYSQGDRIEPYILYGKWVKVSSSSGKSGYVVNQYLLPLSPVYSPFHKEAETPFDTVSINNDGWPMKYRKYSYPLGIFSLDYINEKAYVETFHFPDMTIAQVFVMLDNADRELPFSITKNWVDTLHFNDNELCDISIKQIDNYVELIWVCSC